MPRPSALWLPESQARARNGSASCPARSSRAGAAAASCSTGTGRPFRPVWFTPPVRDGNLAQPASTSQIVSTTPRLTSWMSGAWWGWSPAGTRRVHERVRPERGQDAQFLLAVMQGVESPEGTEPVIGVVGQPVGSTPLPLRAYRYSASTGLYQPLGLPLLLSRDGAVWGVRDDHASARSCRDGCRANSRPGRRASGRTADAWPGPGACGRAASERRPAAQRQRYLGLAAP